MAAYVGVKGFERFQHYKDRNPPWIKLYNELLDDYEFGLLTDATKWHLVAIWLLASRYNNRIPADAKWIGQRINATGPVDIVGLVKSGFLIPDQGCSEMLATRKQSAMPETEREAEGETDTSLRSVAKSRSKRIDEPTEEHRQLAAELGVSCQAEWLQYVDHFKAKGGRQKDEEAGFRNWLRRAKTFHRGSVSRVPTLQERRAANIAALTGQVKHEREVFAERVDRAAVPALPGALREPDDDDVGRFPHVRSQGGMG